MRTVHIVFTICCIGLLVVFNPIHVEAQSQKKETTTRSITVTPELQQLQSQTLNFGCGNTGEQCWCNGGRLLLDSRVVDVPMSYNPIVVTRSSLKPFFFNGLT